MNHRSRLLDFADHPALRPPEPAGACTLRELPAGDGRYVFETLRLLFSFAGRTETSGWFSGDQLVPLEHELLQGALELPIRSALSVIVGELAAPGGPDELSLIQACVAAADWAFERRAENTALAFLEAAALCRPDNGRLAYLAGKCFKTHHRARDAERWLRRASALGRWGRDWHCYVLSENALGMLYWDQGANAHSGVHLQRARRLARKHGMRDAEGVALHNLFVLGVTSNHLEGVEDYARKALVRYLPDHPRIPALVYDIAYYWLTRGYARRALPIFAGLVAHFPAPSPRIQVLAALARAAGASGEHAAFEAAWEAAARLLPDPEIRGTRAAALIDLGLGAAHRARWEDADRCFTQAAASAKELGQCDMLVRAETCSEAVRHHENPDTLATLFVR